MYDVCVVILKITKSTQKMYACIHIRVKIDRYWP
jgi:hypothetical protein